MEWKRLLSTKRVSATGQLNTPSDESARSKFERDWDRLIFSNALRRMHDKTQVFPLPEDDVVHSRLTHSLEAASVGRSLAHAVGASLVQRHDLSREGLSASDFSAIVAAACLAHDIGNPPFGHAGEDAIAEFFKRDEVGVAAIAPLSPEEQADFTAFEGNAQGFRTITRLQLESDGGLRLTAASLAAFMKYPRLAGPKRSNLPARPETKKHGVHLAERATFSAVCEEVGLVSIKGAEEVLCRARHPLAYLVEAADDICYSILDIEDGVRLNLVSAGDAEDLLLPIAQGQQKYEERRRLSFGSARDRVGYLRAVAIAQLISECTQVFLDAEDSLLGGRHDRSLKNVIPSGKALDALNAFARAKCYQSRAVLEIELAGYEAIGGLLHDLVEAVLSVETKTSGRNRKILTLLETQGIDNQIAGTRYQRLLRVTDYVAGMTDRFALSLFRRIRGISVPGRLG